MAKGNGTEGAPGQFHTTERETPHPHTLSVGDFLNHLHGDILDLHEAVAWVFWIGVSLVVERIIFYLVRLVG